MKKKTIIFDMDGVLVDSEWQFHQILTGFLKKNKIILPEHVLRQIVGMDWDHALSLILHSSEIGWTEEEFDNRLEVYKDQTGCLHYDACIFQDTKETLQSLRGAGHVLALASSSKETYVNRMLEECGLRNAFRVILSREDVEKSKPDPEIYLKAAEKLGVLPQECMAVEDSFYGISAAKKAGMMVVALKSPHYKIDQSAADIRIEHLKELLQL